MWKAVDDAHICRHIPGTNHFSAGQPLCTYACMQTVTFIMPRHLYFDGASSLAAEGSVNAICGTCLRIDT